MTAILNTAVPAAGTYTGQQFQLRPMTGQPLAPAHFNVQETFTYGSGGTTIDVYLQTSYDSGVSWCDAIHFAQLLLASSRVVWGVQSAPPAAAVTPTDGTATVNTVIAGVFGSWWRVKYVVVGAYVGSTLRVDAFTNVNMTPAGVNAFN